MMRNLKSEILFNRALLWLVLAGLVSENKPLMTIYLIACISAIWSSYKAWEG